MHWGDGRQKPLKINALSTATFSALDVVRVRNNINSMVVKQAWPNYINTTVAVASNHDLLIYPTTKKCEATAYLSRTPAVYDGRAVRSMSIPAALVMKMQCYKPRVQRQHFFVLPCSYCIRHLLFLERRADDTQKEGQFLRHKLREVPLICMYRKLKDGEGRHKGSEVI